MARPALRVASSSRWLHSAVAGPSTAPASRARRDRLDDRPSTLEKELLSGAELSVARSVIRQAKQNQRRDSKAVGGSSKLGTQSQAALGRRHNSTLASGKVKYMVEQSVQSFEQQAFFAAGDEDGEIGMGGDSHVLEDEYGLECGLVVECRRSGIATIGMIVAPVLVSMKPRLLLLRSSGEVWPVTAADVQYILPRSLIPADLVEEAWNEKDLVENYVPSEEALAKRNAARQKIAMTLRKVERETDKMLNILVRSKAAGVEAVWKHFSNPDAGQIGVVTATQAAEYLLDKPVRAQTLPAFAAHRMLMARPEMFVADEGSLWESGRFTVRSKDQRRLLRDVLQWTREPAGTGPLAEFAERTNAIIAVSRQQSQATGTLQPVTTSLPAFTPSDLDLISALQHRLFEIRSTQISPFLQLTPSIIKATNAYPGETVDEALVHRFLSEIGAVPEWDTLGAKRLTESSRRDPSPVLLDNLTRVKPTEERHDFTDHTVYVIDDPSASELDDGISIEPVGTDGQEYWVHVHVADPTRLIDPDHALAKQAARQVSSLYFVEGNHPLLDDPVVMRELSLGARCTDQEVMTFSTRLGLDGSVKESKVRLGLVRNFKVISYSQVDEILGAPVTQFTRPFGGQSKSTPKMEIDETSSAVLKNLQKLARACFQRRMANGGFSYGVPAAGVSINDRLPSHNRIPTLYNAFPSLDYAIPSTVMSQAQLLVSEFMIVAGQTAARFSAEHGIAVPFRNGKAPVITRGPETINSLLAKRDPETFALDSFDPITHVLYTPPSASEVEPADHWQMGILASEGGYIRATSPLRRYGDLLVHWQIRSALAGTKTISAEEMTQEAKRFDRVTTRIKRASKANDVHWQMVYLARVLAGSIQPSAESVDLQGVLQARIMGIPVFSSGDHVTYVQVYVPSIGVVGRLNHKGMQAPDTWVTGEYVDVRIDSAEQYPSPLLILKQA